MSSTHLDGKDLSRAIIFPCIIISHFYNKFDSYDEVEIFFFFDFISMILFRSVIKFN